jgi:DNA-binding PadR family transcriptional regulator
MSPAPKSAESLRDPAAHLPLTTLAFHILLALADDRRHGYGIIRDIEARTRGSMRLRSGTLYTAIYRLQDDGLVGECPPERAPEHEDRRRRYFEITKLGRQVAELEARRLADLLSTATERALFPDGVRT